MFQPWLWSDWLYHLMPTGKEYKSAVNRLHEFTREVRAKINNNDDINHNILRNRQNFYLILLNFYLIILFYLNEFNKFTTEK